MDPVHGQPPLPMPLREHGQAVAQAYIQCTPDQCDGRRGVGSDGTGEPNQVCGIREVRIDVLARHGAPTHVCIDLGRLHEPVDAPIGQSLIAGFGAGAGLVVVRALHAARAAAPTSALGTDRALWACERVAISPGKASDGGLGGGGGDGGPGGLGIGSVQ